MRVVVSATAGIVASAAAASFVPWQVTVLAGWDVALATYIAWMWSSVAGLDPETTRRVAMAEDLSHAQAEVLLIAASVMNLVVVGLALVEATGQGVVEAGLINGATVLSVALSWSVVHTVYAFRYARLYYAEGRASTSPAVRRTTGTSRTSRSRSA